MFVQGVQEVILRLLVFSEERDVLWRKSLVTDFLWQGGQIIDLLLKLEAPIYQVSGIGST